MNETGTNLPTRHDGGRVGQPQPQAYPAYPAAAEEREGNAFGSIFDMIVRRAPLILGVFVAVSALGVGLTLLQTPKYSSTALLMIETNPDQVVSEKQSLSSSRADSGLVDSEIEVLKSPTLAARLASELGLDKDPEWTGPAKTSGETNTANLTRSNNAIGFPGAVRANVERPSLLSAFPDLPADLRPEAAKRPVINVADEVVDSVAKAIDIRRRGLSYVVEISAESQSPKRSAEMANSLANIYLKSLAEARYDVSEKANLWLTDRLDELKAEVLQKQAAAQAYRAQRNLLTAGGVSLVETQLAQVQSSLLQTRAEYAQKQAEYNGLADYSKDGKTVAISGVSADSMRELRSQEAQVAQRIADLESRYGPEHPSLIQAKEEKASLDTRIREEMQRTTNKSKVEAEALSARLNTQESELNSLRGQLVTDNFDQVRLDALETDASAAQSVYESFLQRYHEVARQGSLAAAVGARLLSEARPPPAPSSPHLLFNGALSVAAGLVLGLLAGLLAEQFRGTIETTEEVEQRVGARALVAIPALRSGDLRRLPKLNRSPTGYLVTKRMSPFAEAFRVLQASILLTNQGDKVVAITSAMPGDGKTTLSLGLARVAAMGGQKVIVVDCDVRMRSLNKMLGIDPKEGLQQVLEGEKHWKEVVGCDQASGAHVLPSAGVTSKDIFGTGAMELLIAELRQEYDLVVLDCAPVFAVAETRLVAALADTVVVTARARKTPGRALAAAISQLEMAGARVLGVALNRVDIRRGRRSFYDGLYYSKAFSGYYARES
ncbi:MAG: AAA family ATPase [Hyphomonadaceae bacterium]|nr:AAA family ATPase [Hyphomonadaceae bacterium]